MRNVRSNILKALLAFFGMNLFTSCYGIIPARYYEISGTVEDQQHRPIRGILVTPQNRMYIELEDSTDVIQASLHGGVLTDINGRFRLEYADYGAVLDFKDIDGPANGGEFESRTVNFESSELTREHAWYDNTYHVHDAKIVLQKKQ